MELVWLIARCLLAAVLAVAAVGKALDPTGSRKAVEDFGVPARFSRIVGTGLPIVELALASALLIASTATAGAWAASALLMLFCASIYRLMRVGEAPDCHCFGQIQSEPAGPSTLIRNGVLAAIALGIALDGPGLTFGEATGTEAALVGTSVAAALLGLYAYGLRREVAGLRRAPFETDMGLDAGLPAGSPVPDVEMTRLDGTTSQLTDVISGRPSLLVHVGLRCQPCHEMMPELLRWRTALSEHLEFVVLTSGALEDGREFAETHDFADLLVSTDIELPMQLRMASTPGAVAVDRDGRIEGAPAFGGMAIEHLVRMALRRAEDAAPSTV